MPSITQKGWLYIFQVEKYDKNDNVLQVSLGSGLSFVIFWF